MKRFFKTRNGKIALVLLLVVGAYFGARTYLREKWIAEKIASIKKNPEWLAEVQRLATAEGKTLEARLREHALWSLAKESYWYA